MLCRAAAWAPDPAGEEHRQPCRRRAQGAGHDPCHAAGPLGRGPVPLLLRHASCPTINGMPPACRGTINPPNEEPRRSFRPRRAGR